jgi:4-carboxymuconolactone decarboxylase
VRFETRAASKSGKCGRSPDPRRFGTTRDLMTTVSTSQATTLATLDDPTRTLVRVAAIVSAGSEGAVRDALADAQALVPHPWIEELLLQTYLFAGFPRALNAFREWRRRVPLPAESSATEIDTAAWSERGRETCRAVYGGMYEKLRENIHGLHPALDSWMIVEGYGKVLSRPGLDLPRRELCIVAACVASGQDRQLHSHLHGALNVGVAPAVVRQSLDALASAVSDDRLMAARRLFERVTGK